MKKYSIIAVAIFVSILVAACGTPAPKVNMNDSAQVATLISTNYDSFKKHTTYTGPNSLGYSTDTILIRAWKTETGRLDYQIYVNSYYSGEWRFYDSAYDSDGNKLDTTQISRKVGSCSRYGCSHDEHLGINVSRKYLEERQGRGVSFKISGRGGEQVYFLPAGYIKAFVDVVK